jgi:iron complex transport system permease protein
MLVGADHRRSLPIMVVGGATALLVFDLLARTLARPSELPLGVVTAAVGAPFFLWLLRRTGSGAG